MAYTAQHSLQGPSGLPEDRYVNVFRWAVGIDPGHAVAADIIALALEDFYTVAPADAAPNNRSIMSFMPAYMEADAEIRVYDDSDPEPREPEVRTYSWAGASAQPLPSEVALCLSFYGSRNLPRQRGRLYIGPLNNDAVQSGSGAPARPGTNLMHALMRAGERLSVPRDGGELYWAVRSAGPYADGSGAGVVTHYAVTDGWVDDAFDTQRSRGEEPTSRITWTRPAA